MLRQQPPSKKTKINNASAVIEEIDRDEEDGGIQSEDVQVAEIQSKVSVESVPSFYPEVYF